MVHTNIACIVTTATNPVDGVRPCSGKVRSHHFHMESDMSSPSPSSLKAIDSDSESGASADLQQPLRLRSGRLIMEGGTPCPEGRKYLFGGKVPPPYGFGSFNRSHLSESAERNTPEARPLQEHCPRGRFCRSLQWRAATEHQAAHPGGVRSSAGVQEPCPNSLMSPALCLLRDS